MRDIILEKFRNLVNNKRKKKKMEFNLYQKLHLDLTNKDLIFSIKKKLLKI